MGERERGQAYRHNTEKERDGFLRLFSSEVGWLEGTAESQPELEPRLRGRARAELGLLREEPGLGARAGREGGV